MDNKEYPFDEETISVNEVIRTFDENISSEELVWHRDHEDRLIEAIGESDWLIQIDNEIPQKMNKVFIPKGTYHRVIKGSGTLKVKIKKFILPNT